MASTEGLVPITRRFLASYYDKYPFAPLPDDVSRLSDEIRSITSDLLKDSPPRSQDEEEIVLLKEAEGEPPHKIDENMWKNREHMEEILFLLDKSRCPPALQNDSELASVFSILKDKFQKTLSALQAFQAKNSDHIFNTVMTYMPQDFRGTLIRKQKERSERNKQAEVDALVNSGGSIRDQYAVLWRQQMDRRRQLAQLGLATGVYKTLVKYLVGVPQVLLDFIRQINDDDGPMEEQRQRYGPPLYSLTVMVLLIRLFISLAWGRFEAKKLTRDQVAVLEQAVDVYTNELERFLSFISEVFANSPFFISAEAVGALEARNNDDYKEVNIPAGKTHEVSLSVESVNSYIAWDFSLTQGKMNMDIGFSVECTDPSGQKALILPYRRYESDQGNFSTCISGNYKFIWDNSYSAFFKKVLRYKVDCIPPVVEPVQSAGETDA
uniref:GOLD domain-containing protein n=2 Tax=Salix viminalis TaxID=40686 RepID=A0A6N2K6T1_SALVM